MEVETYICDREQCRYEGPPPPDKPMLAKVAWGAMGVFFLFTGVLTIVAIIGVVFVVVGVLCFVWLIRKSCPACRRGAMLSTTRNRRGVVLKQRKEQLERGS